MTKRMRKICAAVVASAMVVTSITWPELGKRAAAEEALTLDESQYSASKLSLPSGDVLTSTQKDTGAKDTDIHVQYKDGNVVLNGDGSKAYDGYIVSNSSEALSAKYLKITYTIADTSSLKADSKLFTFQPYTSNWEGWQDNLITFKDAIKGTGNTYTSYISVRTIKGSMEPDQECAGINLSFFQEAPAITLTGYYAMTVKASKNPNVEIYDTDDAAKLEEAREYKYTCQQLIDAGVSENDIKAVINTKTTVTPYIKVTKAHSRSWLKFSVGGGTKTSNKSLVGIEHAADNGASSAQYMIHCGYGTGKEGTGVGAAGTGIYNKTSPIDTGKWTENKTLSMSEYFFRLQILTKDTEARLLGVVVGNVKFSIAENGTISNGFNASAYTYESDKQDSTDVKPKSEAELKSEAEDALWLKLRSAKNIKKDDCLTEALYNALQTQITKSQAVLDNAASNSTALNAALTSLQNAIKDATDEPLMGLKKAIDYCKGLREGDYTSASFAKLAPAVAAAESVYAVGGSKTNAELKTARDTLEAVRVALVPKMSGDTGNPKDFRILSKKDVVKEMGAGINLGNTMDGGLYNPTETGWQAYKTTKAYIKALHDAGYNTVRIPVTWNGYIKDDYTIDPAWIGRVQEIVDYCVEQDMYAIINIHHDGAANHDNRGDNTPTCWLDTYQWDIEKVYQKYQGVWKNIAEQFKDYDEHLIFEGMNEVTDSHNNPPDNEDTAVLNALNQLFINTVRATGSNNTKRWLAITGRFATFSTGTTMPEDTLADKGDVGTTRLMFSVHIYKGNSNVRWSYNDSGDKGSLHAWLASMNSSSDNVKKLDANMPLYVGEFGVRTQAQSGSATGYNNAERALNYEYCTAAASYFGAVPIVWDQGSNNYLGIETQTGLFTDWDRPNLKPVYENVVKATIRGTLEEGRSTTRDTMLADIYKSYGHASTSDNGVSTDPKITPATDITLSTTSVAITAGERITVKGTSDSSRDLVVWSTDNDSVATVSAGLIHAKGIGITKVHARTQSGSVEKDISVIVQPSGKETAKGILTEKPYYEIVEGGVTDH